MNITGSVVRSYSSGMAASHRPSESRAPTSSNTSSVPEPVVEGEVLNKRARPESSSSSATFIASGDKVSRYLQYSQNNMQEISVGYYVDYFA